MEDGGDCPYTFSTLSARELCKCSTHHCRSSVYLGLDTRHNSSFAHSVYQDCETSTGCKFAQYGLHLARFCSSFSQNDDGLADETTIVACSA